MPQHIHACNHAWSVFRGPPARARVAASVASLQNKPRAVVAPLSLSASNGRILE